MTFAVLDVNMAKQINRAKAKKTDDQLQEQLELYRQFLPLKEAVRAYYRQTKGVDFITQGAIDLDVKAYKMTKPQLIDGQVIPPQIMRDRHGNPIPLKKRTERTELSSSYQKNDITKAVIQAVINEEKDLRKKRDLIIANKAREKLLMWAEGIVVKLANQRATMERNNPLWYSDLASDLIQYCHLPLSYCIWHYNPVSPKTGLPVKFTTYATEWIKLGIRDYMKNLSGMSQSEGEKVVYYRDVRDQDGSYTSIFEVHDLAVETNTIDCLIEREDTLKRQRQQRHIKKVLTPSELEELLIDNPTDIYKGTIFESLAPNQSVLMETKRKKIKDELSKI